MKVKYMSISVKLKYLIKLVCVIIILVISTQILSKYLDLNKLDSQLGFVQCNKHTFAILRWLFILIIILFWKRIIKLLGTHLKIKSENLQRWQTMRWTIAIWLIIFELLINDNIVVTILQKI
jgi:hypothetical protein